MFNFQEKGMRIVCKISNKERRKKKKIKKNKLNVALERKWFIMRFGCIIVNHHWHAT